LNPSFFQTGKPHHPKMATLLELLPKEYGYVAIVLVIYTFLNFYMAFQVGKARKK
jgi:glutathione S-transferase